MIKNSKPGVVGIVTCILEIAALVMTGLVGYGVIPDGWQAFITVVAVIGQCVCMHLIRSTAKIYGKHVWRVKSLITLFLIPAFDFALLALSLLAGMNAGLQKFVNLFIDTLPGVLITVAFSLPLFMLYYFIYLFRKFCDTKHVKVVTIVMAALCFLYVLAQIFDKCVRPLIERSGSEAPGLIVAAASHSLEIAICVYLTAAVGFVFLQLSLNKRASAEET